MDSKVIIAMHRDCTIDRVKIAHLRLTSRYIE